MSSQSNSTRSEKSMMASGVVLSVVFVCLIVAVFAKELNVLESAVAKQIVGLCFGVVLILAGNLLPKFVKPLNAQNANPARVRTFERFAGWAFVLAGITYIAVWLFAPQSHAMLISSSIGLGAFAVVAAAWVWSGEGKILSEHFKKEVDLDD